MNCPNCKRDVENIIVELDVSPYGGYFECPYCNTVLERYYDESWDGKEEQQYYWLEIVDVIN